MAKVNANMIESGIFILRGGEIDDVLATNIANHNELIVREGAGLSPKLYLSHETGSTDTKLHGVVMDSEWLESIEKQRMMYNGVQPDDDAVDLDYTGPDGFNLISGDIVNIKANAVCKATVGGDTKLMALYVSAQIRGAMQGQVKIYNQEYISSTVEYVSDGELGNISFGVKDGALQVRANGYENSIWQVEIISLVQV